MKLVKTTMDKLLAQFQVGELSAGLVCRAPEQYGAPCVVGGEKWFAMPGPAPGHVPFWVRQGQVGTLADSHVPDGAPDEVLSRRYGVELAGMVNVAIGVPEELDAAGGEQLPRGMRSGRRLSGWNCLPVNTRFRAGEGVVHSNRYLPR